MTHMDGVALYAMTQELMKTLDNGRIERISRSGKYEYTLVVRANNKNHRLLLSADPESARLHLTEKGAENREPVSYTHLDVYKRQKERRCLSFILSL